MCLPFSFSRAKKEALSNKREQHMKLLTICTETALSKQAVKNANCGVMIREKLTAAFSQQERIYCTGNWNVRQGNAKGLGKNKPWKGKR